MEIFINEIKEFPELYSKKNAKYKDTKHKNKLWESLSSKYDFDAKIKWTHLRDYYCKVKKARELPSGSKRKMFNEWPLYEHMKYIDDHLQPRKMRENVDILNIPTHSENEKSATQTENLNIGNSSENLESFVFQDVDESVEECLMSPSVQSSRSTTFKKRKDSEVQEIFINSLKKIGEEINFISSEAEDEDWYFLKSVHIKMKKLDEPQKTELKTSILLKIQELQNIQ